MPELCVSSISSVMGRTAGSSCGAALPSGKSVSTCLVASSGTTEDRSPVSVSSPSSTHCSAAMVAISLVAEARYSTSSIRSGRFSPDSRMRCPRALS